MKCLSFIKPLNIRPQIHDIDVHKAYRQVDDLKGDLKLSWEQIDTQF